MEKEFKSLKSLVTHYSVMQGNFIFYYKTIIILLLKLIDLINYLRNFTSYFKSNSKFDKSEYGK